MKENRNIEQRLELKKKICELSVNNTTNAKDLILFFQTLISARESRVFMEAPGLYYRDLSLYVISKAGMNRGHTTMHKSIEPFIPEDKSECYAFVLYPGSFIRSCFDKVLRKTAKVIAHDLRLSMENVFNRKYHHGQNLVGSSIEQELVDLLKKDM